MDVNLIILASSLTDAETANLTLNTTFSLKFKRVEGRQARASITKARQAADKLSLPQKHKCLFAKKSLFYLKFKPKGLDSIPWVYFLFANLNSNVPMQPTNLSSRNITSFIPPVRFDDFVIKPEHGLLSQKPAIFQ